MTRTQPDMTRVLIDHKDVRLFIVGLYNICHEEDIARFIVRQELNSIPFSLEYGNGIF